MKKNIPNILTLSRFVLIPFIIVSLVCNKYLIAFILLTISGLTDVLDGFIARKFNFITDFGKLIDPLADKATQLSILITLSLKTTSSGEPIIPIWILFIIFIKEFMMIAGASFLYGKNVVVYSKWYGKLATVLFYLAIVISLITKQLGVTGFWSNLDMAVYCLALIATIFSLIMYIKCLYQDGFIDKSDLNKDAEQVIVKNKRKKKSENS